MGSAKSAIPPVNLGLSLRCDLGSELFVVAVEAAIVDGVVEGMFMLVVRIVEELVEGSRVVVVVGIAVDVVVAIVVVGIVTTVVAAVRVVVVLEGVVVGKVVVAAGVVDVTVVGV